MENYADGTQVEVIVPLVNRAGDAISAVSVSYRVIDQTGAELVAPTNSATFQAGDPNVTIVVPALVNTLPVDAIREIRSIELTCIVAGNTVQLSHTYMIESANPLVAGLNSFQTLEQAKLNAFEIYNLEGWQSATDDQRIVALIEARAKIARLNLIQVSVPQNKMADLVLVGDLLELTQAEFLALDAAFIKALQLAQIAEASDILGYTESTAQKRNDGLMLDTIGEVKQMFRSGKPLELPVCKKALGYLSKYISYALAIGRA